MMAPTFTITPLPRQALSLSPFMPRDHVLNIPNCSSSSIIPRSIYNKNTLKILCQQQKHKQSIKDKNVQIGGLGFAVLDALKSDKSPKIRTKKPPENDSQSLHKNEEKKTNIPLQENRKHNDRNPSSPEDSYLDKNDDILDLNSREKVKPSLSGEDILLALQRASAQKANEERRRKAKKKNASRGDNTRRGSLGMVPRILGEVRPITVKPECGARIESLEKRLKELKERADFA